VTFPTTQRLKPPPFDQETSPLQPHPLDMMPNGSCSTLDQRFIYEKYESEFEEGEVEGILDPQQIEEDYSIT